MRTTQGTDSPVLMSQQQKSSKVKRDPGYSSTRKKSNDKWRQQSKQLREVTDCVITHFEVIFSNERRFLIIPPPPNRLLRHQGLLARLRKKEKASEYVKEQCGVGFTTVLQKMATQSLVICLAMITLSAA